MKSNVGHVFNVPGTMESCPTYSRNATEGVPYSANGNGNGDGNGNGQPMCGAVLVCGGGIAGIQAALDLSAAGFRVYLVEESPTIGGGMSRLDKTFPTGDCATCIISPKLVECLRDYNVDVLTMADVTSLEGEPGHFKASVRRRPRFVDMGRCTACGDCAAACPVELSNRFEAGLGKRKAIDKAFAQAAPNAFFITKRSRGPCGSGCPIDTNVQGYVALVGAGKYREAAELIRQENPLPSVCGRVCFHPCESRCNRAVIDEPVNIRALKRFAIDQHREAEVPQVAAPSGKSVAIIGSGPAGLAAAHGLAIAGHKVDVFEALPVLGGMLAVGIPDYRLPPEILRRDLEAIAALGVAFHPSTAVGKNLPPDRLLSQFDAVFVATGAHQSRKLEVPGEDCQGVVHGVDFLRRFSLGDPAAPGRRVVIVGGGNTAIDAARTAVRLGANEVTVVYRRSRKEMPADPAEIAAAEAEGVRMRYRAAPVKVLSHNGRLSGVECIGMELGEPDASGRRRPVPIEGSNFTLAAETLIPAVSQSPDRNLAALLGLKTGAGGAIDTDPLTMATSRPGVFAGGDVVLGPSSVIEAIGQGKRAAVAIDNYLAGRPMDRRLQRPVERPNSFSPEELDQLRLQAERARRVIPQEIPAAERVTDFREVERTYTADEAQTEALRCLNCGCCCECLQCVKACQAGAVCHDQSEETLDLEVGAVVLTPGFEAFDATRRGEFGFRFAPNVLTNVQLERMLSASGPTGGHIRRPSDGKPPKRIAFIQCVGSRDTGCDNDYCSSVCCMAATKEAILAKEHEPGLDVTIFFLDLRAFGKDFDRYYDRAKNRLGVRYVRSFISRTYEMPGTRNLRVTYAKPVGPACGAGPCDEKRDATLCPEQVPPGRRDLPPGLRQIEEEFDMIVLSLGLEPSATLQEQAERLQVVLNRWGFAETSELCPLDTSRPGVFVGGAFQEPKDIPDTVMQASAAAARAMALLAPARGTRVRTKTYPPQRDITDEPPRVGVFICHCGSNIASVVDVERAVKRARELPHVVVAETHTYTCADDTQNHIKEKIAEHRLNRVVVASCTPRTHEPIFRDTLRDAGLNPYLLEMANIRDQCSWVHSASRSRATEKAIDLVRMAAARAARLMPLHEEQAPVNNAALVVGGGVAGMTAALALADQNFPVHLVEKSGELGGTARQVPSTLSGEDVRAFLTQTIQRVEDHPRITVHRNSRTAKVEGHVGAFTSSLETAKGTTSVKHGVVVVATGAIEHKPQSYGYGQSDKVLTQLELSERLARGELALPEKATVVMIQCVEQRTDERPYCSRVCCTTAVKNALQLRERFPKARIMVVYRDMRTYGFREAAYREAREKGVLFVRYEPENPPEVTLSPLFRSGRGAGGEGQSPHPNPLPEGEGTLRVRVEEPTLRRQLQLDVDLVVLAVGMVPRADRGELSELLRVPLNADGFFLEAHMKLRPVDFASEGLFLCGTAHAPKFLGESIAQAHAVAGRAASILARKTMSVGAQRAWVDTDKCISCMTCVHVCPYMAPQPNEFNKAEVQGAVCMGCGSCSAECPAKAITLRHYVDSQVLAAVEGLLGLGFGHANLEPLYPEQVGVAPPRWHQGE